MTSSAKPLRVEAPLNTEIPKLSKDDKDSINSHISNIEDKSLVRRPCGCVRTSDKLKNILKTFPQAPPPTGSCRNRIPVNYLQTDQASMEASRYSSEKRHRSLHGDLSSWITTSTKACSYPFLTGCRNKILANYLQEDQGNGRFCNHRAYPATIPTIYIHDLSELQEEQFKVQEKLRKEKEEEERKDKEHSNKCKTLFYELVSLLQLSVTATALVIYYIIFCYMQLIYYVLRSIVYFHHADLPMKITITLVTVTGVFIGLNMISRLENLVGVHFRKM